MTAFIFADGLADAIKFFEAVPEEAETAMVTAVNQVVQEDAMTKVRRDMRQQVAFPSGYLEQGRLRIAKKARRGSVEAVIAGRDRATSLARFAPGQTPSTTRGKGVKLTIKPGQTKQFNRLFMVKLRNGNQGVAVRLKPGETLNNSESAVRLADNVYLLYGPSVDQVFRGVAQQNVPFILEKLQDKFLRQFLRGRRGRT